MSKFDFGHLKTKKMRHAVRYILDQYKIQQMCDKGILENGGTLKSVPDYYKNHEMCNKSVDNYPHALEFVAECFMTRKICDKAVNTYPSTIIFFPNALWHKNCVTKEVRDVFCIWFYS